MEGRRQSHPLPNPPQFPPLIHPQSGASGGGAAPHPRQPLPLSHSHMGLGPRPSGSAPPLSGHKRPFHHRAADGGGLAKLFVGSLPRNISEDEVRGLFGAYGNVIEVVFLKDKKTGLPQGCCFIKYATTVEAERAIRALDNQRTLPGGPAPLQVKFADGERDHSGPVEHKLFVGSLNKQATEQEIEEIFAPFGRVENIYIIRDEHKQSRGCAFVTFPERDMAIGAISALNGVYRMAGCHQPIIVRFADPKRPRSGDQRSGGPGPNYSPRSHQGPGGARGSGATTMGARSPVYGWRQGGSGGVGLLPQTGILPMGRPVSPSLRGSLEGPSAPMAMRTGGAPIQAAPSISGPLSMSGMSPQVSQQHGFSDASIRKPGQVLSQQIPLHQQQPQQLAPHVMHPYQLQTMPGLQPSDTRSQQLPLGPYSSPQPTAQIYGQGSMAHHQLQMQPPVAAMTPQMAMRTLRQQETQPTQQPIMVPAGQSLQRQPLQVHGQMEHVKETTQQAYIQMTTQQLPVTMQPSWSVPVQQQTVTSVGAPTTPVSVAPVPTTTTTTATCDWTEHTSPEGHKYYYNSKTGESRWEKPDEYAVFEQQQQLQTHIHLQSQQIQPQLAVNPQYQQLHSHPQQHLSTQPVQNPAQQMQHYHHPQLLQGSAQQPQMQQSQLVSSQQQTPSTGAQLQYDQTASGASYQPPVQGYVQTQPPNGTHQQQIPSQQVAVQTQSANGMNDQARAGQWVPTAQQGLHNQEWMWKSKPTVMHAGS